MFNKTITKNKLKYKKLKHKQNNINDNNNIIKNKQWIKKKKLTIRKAKIWSTNLEFLFSQLGYVCPVLFQTEKERGEGYFVRLKGMNDDCGCHRR
jgi:hypothetical protein